MKSFRSCCQLFLACVAATLIAPSVTEARSARPFKASISITETVQPDTTGVCPFLAGAISGTGQATHLGKMTLVSRDCITPIGENVFAFESNQLVLTAANGDQIFAIYSGIFTTEGAVGAISGGYHIVGGTGRFSQATGAGSVQGVEDLSTGKGQVQLTGTISY
jgi:hypothetical protein